MKWNSVEISELHEYIDPCVQFQDKTLGEEKFINSCAFQQNSIYAFYKVEQNYLANDIFVYT